MSEFVTAFLSRVFQGEVKKRGILRIVPNSESASSQSCLCQCLLSRRQRSRPALAIHVARVESLLCGMPSYTRLRKKRPFDPKTSIWSKKRPSDPKNVHLIQSRTDGQSGATISREWLQDWLLTTFYYDIWQRRKSAKINQVICYLDQTNSARPCDRPYKVRMLSQQMLCSHPWQQTVSKTLTFSLVSK